MSDGWRWSMASARPAWLPERLFPFESRYLEVEGCRVHYVDEGSGPTLLLLHGNPTYSFLYRGIILGLRDRFRCVALDYPGFGLSTARAGYDFRPASHSRVVEAFADLLGLDAITPVVQDWGGPIGLGFAGRRPERIRALVIGDSWAWPDVSPRMALFSKIMGSALGSVLIRRANLFVNVLLPAGMRRAKPSPEVMAAYRGPFPTPGSRLPIAVFPREILASHAFLGEVARGLERLADRAALVVWGDADPAFGASERVRFEALLPRHRTVLLRGASHYIQEDAPAEIAGAIREWWDADVTAAEAAAHPHP
jgi:haloalkane dehalogenase